jgi:hypothetical protein
VATVETYAIPAPPPSDEPQFQAAVDNMIYSDNMSEYTTPDAMDTWPAPSFHPYWPTLNESHYAVITPGRGGVGQALRLLYDGQNNQPDNDGQRFLWWLVPPSPSTSSPWYADSSSAIVIQYWFRISKNGGPGGGPGYGSTDKGMKWLELWRASGDVQRSQFGPTAGNATTGPLWHMHAAGSDSLLGFQPVGPYWNNLNDNQWHRATYLYQPKSAAGTDGIARMWVDGTKIVDVSAAAVGITPPGGTKPWCTASEPSQLDWAAIGEIHLGEYLNGQLGDGTTDLPMALDFDDFAFWVLATRIQ